MSNLLTAEDFVIYKENGQIMSGGYLVNSILLNNGGAPIISKKSQTGGENVSSSLFSDLAIPGGLLYSMQNNTGKKFETVHCDKTDDNLFDNLLKMLGPDKKTHNLKTKKLRNKNKITRKHKK